MTDLELLLLTKLAGDMLLGKVDVRGDLSTQTATIAQGGTLSTAIAIGGASLIHIYMPAAFTGTTIRFDSSPTLTGTYQPVRDSNGVEVSVAAAASINTAVTGTPLEALAGCNFIKLRVDAQAAERTFIVTAKG